MWTYIRSVITACLYLRQSKARDDSISLELQEAACRAYCERMGYDVKAVVSEEGVSGYRKWETRPRFREVLQSGADVTVVYRWSRLSRRRLDQLHLIEKLGRVESASESVDVSTAGGRFSRDLLLGVAAFESDVKSEQFKEALARRVAAGLPKNGMPRFGYAKGDDGRYSPDPETGPVLADLYRRYAAGAGFQALCMDLNARGVTTTRGTPWQVQSLLRTMDSGFGAGLLVMDRRSKPAGGEDSWLPGAHEPVVTADEWEAYRAARARRRVEPPRRRTAKWHLSGLAVCGLCGSRLVVNSYDSAKSQAVCSEYKARRTCAGTWMNRVDLEKEVAVWLGGRADRLAAELPQRDAERAAALQARDRAQGSLDGAVRALGRLAADRARGLLDDDGYRGAQAELLAERAEAEGYLTAAREEVERLAPPEDALAALESAPAMTPGEFGALIGRVLRRVEVAKGGLAFVPVVGEPEDYAR